MHIVWCQTRTADSGELYVAARCASLAEASERADELHRDAQDAEVDAEVWIEDKP